MKEAAGEANMTVITIVLIAIVLGVGTIVVNRLMTTSQNKSCCAALGGEVSGGTCKIGSTTANMNKTWRETKCPEDDSNKPS